MPVTLNPTLKTAIEGTTHRPILDISSTVVGSSLPNSGNYLTTDIVKGVTTLSLSTGELVTVYIQDPATGYDKVAMMITGVDKESFTKHTFDYPTTPITTGPVAIELDDGNIGIIVLDINTVFGYMRRLVVDKSGTIVSAWSLAISSWVSITYKAYGIALDRIPGGDYIAIYVREDADGGNKCFVKTTSSNFLSWTSATTFTIGGLDPAQKIRDPNLSTIGSTLYLFFSYADNYTPSGEELWNIYYTSTSDGITWSSAVKVTNYTSFSTTGSQPAVVETAGGSLRLYFTEETTALHMTDTAAGWGATDMSVQMMHFDPATRKLYIVCGNLTFGTKNLEGIAKIDVDTWAIDDYWDTTTTPAFNTIYKDNHIWWKTWWGKGKYVPIGTKDKYYLSVLNGDTGVITNYYFKSDEQYGIVQNVVHSLMNNNRLKQCVVDDVNDRMYIWFWDDYLTSHISTVGYIDLTETPPYNFHIIYSATSDHGRDENTWGTAQVFRVYPDDDLIITSMGTTDGLIIACNLCVRHISDGSLYKQYNHTLFEQFPHLGCYDVVHVNGKLYCAFNYNTVDIQEVNKRGMLEIDMASDLMRYVVPNYSTTNSYNLGFMSVVYNNTKLLMSSTDYGMVLYDINSEQWTIWNEDKFPGISNFGLDNYYANALDETDGIIFCADYVTGYSDGGISAFQLDGVIEKIAYTDGVYTTGWEFGATDYISIGPDDVSPAAAFDETGYVFWLDNNSLKWLKEDPVINLTKYLVKPSDVKIKRAIDSSPHELTFTLSHGHLFDWTNASSIIAPALEKGRRIIVKAGEKVNGVDYWQQQGLFLVEESKTLFKKGHYPKISVTCFDDRRLWEEKLIGATPLYTSTPEAALIDILGDNTNLASIVVPTFDTSIPDCNFQAVKMSLKEVVDTFCGRFGYFPTIDVAGGFTCGKISTTRAIDHVYVDFGDIISIAPNNSFSDHVNRFTAIGQELVFTEVLHEEEELAEITGHYGWYGFKSDITVYFSKDQNTRARNVRLEVVEGSEKMGFTLKGAVSESIKYVDPYEKYIVLEIKADDLTGALIAALAVYIVAGAIPDIVVSFFGGVTIPVGRILEGIAMYAIVSILGSIGNYTYKIWGRPIGEIQRTIQATVNDVEYQTKLGTIISDEVEPPMCYTVSNCSDYANYELEIIKAQRKMISINKIAHYQDLEGDTVQILHPITAEAIKVFVTQLVRTWSLPENDGDGVAITDNLEGWVLS